MYYFRKKDLTKTRLEKSIRAYLYIRNIFFLESFQIFCQNLAKGFVNLFLPKYSCLFEIFKLYIKDLGWADILFFSLVNLNQHKKQPFSIPAAVKFWVARAEGWKHFTLQQPAALRYSLTTVVTFWKFPFDCSVVLLSILHFNTSYCSDFRKIPWNLTFGFTKMKNKKLKHFDWISANWSILPC